MHLLTWKTCKYLYIYVYSICTACTQDCLPSTSFLSSTSFILNGFVCVNAGKLLGCRTDWTQKALCRSFQLSTSLTGSNQNLLFAKRQRWITFVLVRAKPNPLVFTRESLKALYTRLLSSLNTACMSVSSPFPSLCSMPRHLLLPLSPWLHNDDRNCQASRDLSSHFNVCVPYSGFSPPGPCDLQRPPWLMWRRDRREGVFIVLFLPPLSLYLWHLQHDWGHGVTPGTLVPVTPRQTQSRAVAFWLIAAQKPPAHHSEGVSWPEVWLEWGLSQKGLDHEGLNNGYI